MIDLYTICTHPDRRTGEDKIKTCKVFVDRRTYRLPFPVSSKPTEAMLRNNCYGIACDDGRAVLDYLQTLDWQGYCRGGVRGEFNLNMKFLRKALEDGGFRSGW